MSLKGMNRSTGKGPYRHQTAKWKAATAVAMGDLVYRDADGYDHSAADFTWNTNLATTQGDFQPLFRGVSDVRRTTAQTAAGDQNSDGPILASGEFTFPCAALGSAAKPGDYVTIAQGTGNTLDPKKVVVTATASLAIGRVTRDAAIGATELTFEAMPETFIPTPIV